MQNISERIRQTLLQEYGFEICGIHKIQQELVEMLF